jgi:uncharacterized membrane protein (UPF0127 family)
MNRRAFLIALGGAAAAPAFAQSPAGVTFERTPLEIESGGRRHRFTVEMADTDERRTLGLMHRRSMAPDAGMLFDFKRDGPVSMWMRNTFIPLDMLFMDRAGLVRHIHERAVPLSEAIIESGGAVRAVLELNGGTVQRLGLKVGDRLIHPMFRP